MEFRVTLEFGDEMIYRPGPKVQKVFERLKARDLLLYTGVKEKIERVLSEIMLGTCVVEDIGEIYFLFEEIRKSANRCLVAVLRQKGS